MNTVIPLFRLFFLIQVRYIKRLWLLCSIKLLSKFKMELVDPDVQASRIQCMLNLWIKQLSSVINRTACTSILAGAASLVDSVNASSGDVLTSGRDDELGRRY